MCYNNIKDNKMYTKERINTAVLKIRTEDGIFKPIVYKYEIHHKLFGKTFWISRYDNYKGN